MIKFKSCVLYLLVFIFFLSSTSYAEPIMSAQIVTEKETELTGNLLKFKAFSKGSKLTYKWSILKDSYVIYTKEYSNSNAFEYPVTCEGVYYVGVSIKDRNGNIVTCESKKVNVVNKIKVEPAKVKTAEEIEIESLQKYVNKTKNLTSQTDRLIWVNTEKNMVYVFKGKAKEWKLEKKMVCTDGKASTPTVKGNFTVKSRAPWLISYSGKVRAKYKVNFYGNYYFHSILFDSKGKKIVDSRLGKSLSHGCIRLSVENAKWIYDNVADKTAVHVN
ncbi:L,D-transpeptidase [Tepidibacter aestuarii]|uniref:L,D-transpeptidase n=1 Tax=Tepidibacter aestuarii TaxID=2925782 RepID=UPI0020BFE653|nr:L,D-transpeptidase [Tepidibacter aestuarii]CAH2214634.1 L,D-transpeptidase catalytic domain [Tepidibacter aestuarii]